MAIATYLVYWALTYVHRQVPHGGHGGRGPHTFYDFCIGIGFLPYKVTLLSPFGPPFQELSYAPVYVYTLLGTQNRSSHIG